MSSDRFEVAEKQFIEEFGRSLRAARHRAGLSQTEVAELSASSQPFVGGVERGERDIRLSTLLRLAYAVRLDPGALLLGDRAANYSLETLVQQVGAARAHLQAMLGDHAKDLPAGDLPTLMEAFPFRYDYVGEPPRKPGPPENRRAKKE